MQTKTKTALDNFCNALKILSDAAAEELDARGSQGLDMLGSDACELVNMTDEMRGLVTRDYIHATHMKSLVPA